MSSVLFCVFSLLSLFSKLCSPVILVFLSSCLLLSSCSLLLSCFPLFPVLMSFYLRVKDGQGHNKGKFMLLCCSPKKNRLSFQLLFFPGLFLFPFLLFHVLRYGVSSFFFSFHLRTSCFLFLVPHVCFIFFPLCASYFCPPLLFMHFVHLSPFLHYSFLLPSSTSVFFSLFRSAVSYSSSSLALTCFFSHLLYSLSLPVPAAPVTPASTLASPVTPLPRLWAQRRLFFAFCFFHHSRLHFQLSSLSSSCIETIADPPPHVPPSLSLLPLPFVPLLPS